MIDLMFQLLVFPGMVSACLVGLLYEGIARKLTARMQNRVGPPIWQPFFDWFKLMFKENITPRSGTGFLLTLCPVAAFAVSLTLVIFIPISGHALAYFRGNLLVFIYLSIMLSLSWAMAGFASGSPFGSVGSIREITQMFAYEFPFVVSLLTIGMVTDFTIKPFLAWQFPLATLALLVSLQGKLNLPPFHIPDAEQEIVAGPLVEYSGARLGMFSLARAAGLFAFISLGAVLFFGGAGFPMFWAVSFALLVLVTVIRTIFARIRIDQSFRLFWLVIGPLSVIDMLRALAGLY